MGPLFPTMEALSDCLPFYSVYRTCLRRQPLVWKSKWNISRAFLPLQKKDLAQNCKIFSLYILKYFYVNRFYPQEIIHLPETGLNGLVKKSLSRTMPSYSAQPCPAMSHCFCSRALHQILYLPLLHDPRMFLPFITPSFSPVFRIFYFFEFIITHNLKMTIIIIWSRQFFHGYVARFDHLS